MLIRCLKKSLVGLFTLASTCGMLQAAAFISDFNGGIPPGSAVAGNAFVDFTGGVGNSGVLKVTQNINGQNGGFMVSDFAGGAPVDKFKARFKLLIGGGTCCGDRMADGMSFNFAPGINADAPAAPGVWEEGKGNGLSITFDTWDNAGSDTAPAMDVRIGGGDDAHVVAFQAFDPGPNNSLREGGRAPAGPVFLNTADQPMTLFTVPGNAPLVNYVDVEMEVSTFNGSPALTLSFSNIIIWNHLPIPYTPISGGNWVFGGRTGGANAAQFIDNLEIYENYTDGPAAITSQPSDATVFESKPATFSMQVDGTPFYNIQWYRNGTAIPNANGLSYTIPSTTLAMNGDTFYAEVSNAQSVAGPVVSDTVTLTVNSAVLARSATSKGNPNAVYVSFNKPVNLNGTYTVDGGITVNSTAHGATDNDVILDVSPLAPNTLYHLNITGVTGPDGSLLNPDPTSIAFFHGFGTFCTDFNSGLPAGTALYATPPNGATPIAGYISGDGVLHVINNVNGIAGSWVIDNLTGGVATDRWHAKMKVHLGEGSDASRPDGGLADGLSLSWGSDLPNGTVGNAEDGAGTGISVSLDTWDDGTGYDPSIEVRWRGVILTHVHTTLARTGFVDFDVNLDPDGTIDVSYDGQKYVDNLQIPVFQPIANARFGIFARTGGMNMNAWVDDFCLNGFTLGPVTITLQPTDTTAREGESATFTVGVDGTPPYSFQWYKDNVAIPGATSQSYTTPPTVAGDEGSTYYVIVNNEFSSDTSGAGTLHVDIHPRVLSVFSRDNSSLGVSVVHVLYSRDVDSNSGIYDFDTGFEGFKDYGVNHREVVVTLDSLLPQNQIHTVTIQDVTDELDSGNVIDPNPTIKTFLHGFGAYCTDFAANLGVNSTAGPLTTYGVAYIQNGVVHLTDAVNAVGGALVVADPAGGAKIDRLQVKWRALLGGGTVPPADGYSLSIAPDAPNGVTSEEGGGTGLIIAIDNYDNANPVGEAPAIDIKWNGGVIAHTSTIVQQSGANFYDVYLAVDPDGKLDLIYNNTVIYSDLATPFRGFAGAKYNFSARTGSLNENAWIDDLCINGFSLDNLTISREPQDVTVNEFAIAKFFVNVDGVPPYTVQWYSNNVAIPGATTLAYNILSTDRHGEGSLFHAVVSNESGTVTTRDAALHVNLKTSTPTPLWVGTRQGYSSLVVFLSEVADATSVVQASNYKVNGTTVSSAALIPGTQSRYLLLTLSGALNPVDCNILTIDGLKDASGYNTTVYRGMIQMKGAVQASGANNLIVIEAEDYDVNRSPGLSTINNRWTLGSSQAGYSGYGYIESTPDLGVNIGSTTPELTTAVDYAVNFPVAGTYFIWGRGATTHNDGSDNSFHLLLDGASQGVGNLAIGNDLNSWGGGNAQLFGWVNHANGNAGLNASINVATPGVHMVTVSMREDGLKLDRLLLTTDSAFTISNLNDVGPDASSRAPARLIAISRDVSGNATLTWVGAGWTLQGTPKLESNPAATQWTDLPFPSGTVIPVGFFPTAETNVIFRLICK